MSVAHNFPSQLASHQRVHLPCGSRISIRTIEVAAVVMALIAGLALIYPGDVSAQSRAPANMAQASQVQDIAVRTPATDPAGAQTAPARKPVRVIQIWKAPPQQGDATGSN